MNQAWKICVPLFFLILGCDQPPPGLVPAAGPTSTNQGSGPAAATPKAGIELDENVPGARVATTRNFYFVFDGSGSMNENVGDSSGKRIRKLDGAKKAVQRFMDKVPQDVNLGLYVFDDKGQREVVPLGPNNHDTFLKAIMSIKSGGGTPLAESIQYAANRLIEQYKKQLGYGEYRLIAVTDGQADYIPEAVAYAQNHTIPVYAIGLFVDADHPLRTHAFSYTDADSFEKLEQGLGETLAELPSFDSTSFQ